MKLAGAACVLGAALWGWRRGARERRRRWDTLADLVRLLDRMSEEIRLRRTSLPRLLRQLAADRGPDCRSFCAAAALSSPHPVRDDEQPPGGKAAVGVLILRTLQAAVRLCPRAEIFFRKQLESHTSTSNIF